MEFILKVAVFVKMCVDYSDVNLHSQVLKSEQGRIFILTILGTVVQN